MAHLTYIPEIYADEMLLVVLARLVSVRVLTRRASIEACSGCPPDLAIRNSLKHACKLLKVRPLQARCFISAGNILQGVGPDCEGVKKAKLRASHSCLIPKYEVGLPAEALRSQTPGRTGPPNPHRPHRASGRQGCGRNRSGTRL